MPDVREIMLLMPPEAGRFRWGKFFSRLKLAVRWTVAATAGTPLRYFYRAIYRAHIWLAVRVATGFTGTRAVYVSRSLARGEIAYGVSDIDLVVIGEWPEDEQIRVMRRLGALTAFSPLYDSALWQQVHTVDSLRNLWETDYFFQSRFDEGRRQWKLEAGVDLVATLPPIPAERIGGGYYMEARSWWLHFIASAFGSGPTAQDRIFRNSIAYKAVTETFEIARALETGGGIEESRSRSLRTSINQAQGSERDFLTRLDECAARNYIRFRGDIQAESLQYLLPALNQIHARLRNLPSFARSGAFEVDACLGEILLSSQASAHARKLVEHLRSAWPGYRAAYLTPSAACFALDDLLLLIEVDPARLPNLSQLRTICDMHVQFRAQVRQRIALYLLLPAGACQLEFINFTEMWRVLLIPASTPDLFSLIQRPEFRLNGGAAACGVTPVWSRFAYDVALEELNVRRSVVSKVTPDVFPNAIEILRNVWRHLQLEVLVRTSDRGSALFALSPDAIQRGLRALQICDDGLLKSLAEAYQSELAGSASSVRLLIPQIMKYLTSFG